MNDAKVRGAACRWGFCSVLKSEACKRKKEILSENPSSNSLWCSACALIEQLRPFLFPPRPYWRSLIPPKPGVSCFQLVSPCCLATEGKRAPAIPSHKGQLTRRSQSTSSGCYCNTARDDGATKIGFHIQAEQLLTAATTCACLIVTSTEREMVTSMHWLAHLSSIIGFASYSCVFGGSLSLWLGFLSIRRKSPQKLHK